MGETGEVLTIQSRTLPDILSGHGVDVSDFDRPMLVLDVQGHEMSVLQGLGDALRKFDLCKCEVSRVPMYEGGAEFGQILGSSFKCNTSGPLGIGCCDGQTKQAPQ